MGIIVQGTMQQIKNTNQLLIKNVDKCGDQEKFWRFTIEKKVINSPTSFVAKIHSLPHMRSLGQRRGRDVNRSSAAQQHIWIVYSPTNFSGSPNRVRNVSS